MTLGLAVLVALAVLAGIYAVLRRAEARDPPPGSGTERGEGDA